MVSNKLKTNLKTNCHLIQNFTSIILFMCIRLFMIYYTIFLWYLVALIENGICIVIAMRFICSRVAQRKRAGPITQRSVDRNYALLFERNCMKKRFPHE